MEGGRVAASAQMSLFVMGLLCKGGLQRNGALQLWFPCAKGRKPTGQPPLCKEGRPTGLPPLCKEGRPTRQPPLVQRGEVEGGIVSPDFRFALSKADFLIPSVSLRSTPPLSKRGGIMNGHDTAPFHKYGWGFRYLLAVKEAFLFGGLWKREGRANRGGDGSSI